jgi:pimeloyl-ACP methyl ester carboxylesterase
VKKPVMRSVQVGSVHVRYQVLGEGDAVVLVHGLSGSMRWWSRNVRALAQRYQVYVIDLPGFGTMRCVHERFQLVGLADWLLRWMDAVGIKRAHLVGHSMGGYICVLLAAHHPEAVRRLVLVSPAVLSSIYSVWGYVRPVLTSARYVARGFLPVLAYDAARMGPWTLLRTVRDLNRADARNDIAKIQAPTLLVWGENDMLVLPALGERMHTMIAGSRLVILKRAGHVSMFDQPQQFNELLLAFLGEEHEGTGADSRG